MQIKILIVISFIGFTMFGSRADADASSAQMRWSPEEEAWMKKSEFAVTEDGDLFGAIIKDIETKVRAGRQPIVTVDIDDTVIDGRFSLRDDLRSWSKQKAHEETEGGRAVAEYFRKNPKALPGSTPAEVFRSIGLSETSPDFKSFDAYFWKRANLPASAGKTYPTVTGAAERLKDFQRRGARIVYLSGRREDTVGAATRAMLRSAGLPVAAETDVILKNTKADAATFKGQALRKINVAGDVVAAIDNSPGALMRMQVAAPQARMVLLQTKMDRVPEERALGLFATSSWTKTSPHVPSAAVITGTKPDCVIESLEHLVRGR